MRRIARTLIALVVLPLVLASSAVICDVAAGFAYATFAAVPGPPRVSNASAASPPTLVVFGDSLGSGFRATPGHGWIDLLRRRLEIRDGRSHVSNESVPGARVVDLRRQVSRAGNDSARAVFVIAGGNDLMYLTDPLSFARADVALLRDIRARYPAARVVVANVPDISWRSFHLHPDGAAEPLPAAVRIGFAWLANVDNAIVDRTTRRAGADVLDLHAFTLDGAMGAPGIRTISLDEFARRYVSFDGLHPNDRGYEILADFAWPHVARAMRVAP